MSAFTTIVVCTDMKIAVNNTSIIIHNSYNLFLTKTIEIVEKGC